MKTIEEFYNEAMTDKALEEALNKAHKENRLAEFLTEHGVDGTAEAFEALVKAKKNGSRELSDDELETATGGGKNWGDGSGRGVVFEDEELVYRFNIGQEVYVYGLFYDSKAVVIERSYLTGTNFGGAGIKYPRYRVKYSNGSTEWCDQDFLASYNTHGASGSW
ncbi:MAG: hypothetical protein ACI4XA_01065 [Oscillospiraceae bacterium]